MTRKTLCFVPTAAALALLCVGPLVTVALAGEGSASEIAPETRQAVLDTIEDYVRHDVELKETFLVIDPRIDEPLKLTFDHVHEGVKPRGERYLACVDFLDAAGTVHDVDVVVATDGERPRVTEVYLHKVDGEPVETQDRQ